MTLAEASRLTEHKARKYLEQVRWPDGPVCPHCGSKRIHRLRGEAHRSGVYKCGSCRKQFTVTVGTIMHGSHIPLHKWVLAFHLMCSSKKGVSALQLQRNLGLGSYKSAWHLAHRIRLAMKAEPLVSLLRGTVEVDETYVGGKTKGGKRGRGSEKKTAVLALIERDGPAVSRPVDRVDGDTLKSSIRSMVDKSSRIMTDDWKAYGGIGSEFEGGHSVIQHNLGTYSDGDIHTNYAESYFSLLKRGVNGVFHHVSRTHLFRYCDEFSFRWSYRKVDDGERTDALLRRVGGKRLLYKAVLGK
jgi:transposase-like protein